MINMHTYTLPAAVGAFALLFSPIAETAAVAYGLAAFVVIATIAGLHSLAKSNEQKQLQGQQMIQQLEGLNSKIEQLSSKNAELVEVQQEEQRAMMAEVKQQFTVLVSTMQEQSSSVHEQLDKQTTAVVCSLTTLQQKLSKDLIATEDKIDEGNKVIENVSILMMKELQTINQHLDELIGMQNRLPDELDRLQDAITRNQEDLVEGARNVETQLESLKDAMSQQYEQLTVSHQEVVDKIATEFTTISDVVKGEMEQLMKLAAQTVDASATQLAAVNEVLGNINGISTELKKLNNANIENVDKQLKQLVDISGALLKGVAQLTNSQSAERKQLLAIQKNLISKYGK